MKKTTLVAMALLLTCTAAFAQQKGTFTDARDKKTYKTVKIGSQIWMAENLNYNASGSVCYENNPGNCAKYGRLYDWYTAMNACPYGWHLPSKSEYEMLYRAVGGENVAGRKLKAKSGWSNNGNGTDDYGFSALPGGFGLPAGSFYRVGSYGSWWSASEYDSDDAHLRGIFYNEEGAAWGDDYKFYQASVRCMQDETSSPPAAGGARGGVLTDSRDGKKYKTVKIGYQTWMAENLNYNASGSVCYSNNSGYCAKYGRLYDWYTALRACPYGWHLPSKNEYEVLDNVVGGSYISGKKLKAKSGWNSSGNGTDEYGFSALPGGFGYSDGSFDYAGDYGYWWSASEGNSGSAYYRYMDYDLEYASWTSDYKSGLFSVRCLQD